jgi:phenylacetate-CoA ligase
MDWRFDSALAGVAWPAIPAPAQAATLALLHQLGESQWWPRERLEAEQLRQLGGLLRHAWQTVPYYRESWSGRYREGAPQSRDSFVRLPILARGALQANYEALKSRSVPQAHGKHFDVVTSGSTGMPVRALVTEVYHLFWNAMTLRDHLWHRRDLSRTLAVIRSSDAGGEFGSWGPPAEGLVASGRAVAMSLREDAETQLNWLARHDPGYLMSFPSNVAQLARLSLERGVRLPGLLEVRTLSEAFDADLRKLCKEAWGVPLVDVYSARELGYIALQCPQHEHYHVQAESVLVEILDEQGGHCGPGQTGRVVVTDLHNFAMPLIRYDVGDYAEVGEPCVCGRGLPVLRRIAGRVRNTLVTADGKRYWPTFGQRTFSEVAPVTQLQFVQKAPDLVEARLVTPAALTAQQEARLRERIASRLPAGFRVAVVRVDSIPRSASGKFEDFISEIASG